MSHSSLRRPVWLTTKQRLILRQAVLATLAVNARYRPICDRLLTELTVAPSRELGTARLIERVAHGLRMPPGTVPVFVTDRDLAPVLRYGGLTDTLIRVLCDEPPLNPPKPPPGHRRRRS